MQRIAKDFEVAKSIIFLTSENAMKITGHVMKVDGGYSLTSRGQGDWYGTKYMTSKFESNPLIQKANYKLK
jgi:NAD(P)-dependent dehydrogenase (short-subunit alcohol dehydrogenase family)